MEERYVKQLLNMFSDSRLNTSHLAWLTRLHSNDPIRKNINQFFYFYSTFAEQDSLLEDADWMGEKLMQNVTNPDYSGLSNTPPPGTRIVFD